MPNFDLSNKTIEDTGYRLVTAMVNGVEEKVILKADEVAECAEDGGLAGGGAAPDLTGYLKLSDLIGADALTGNNEFKLIVILNNKIMTMTLDALKQAIQPTENP